MESNIPRMTSAIGQSSTGLICQMSRAYSATVRSQEKRPMRATFRIAFVAHAAGLAELVARPGRCVSMYGGRSATWK